MTDSSTEARAPRISALNITDHPDTRKPIEQASQPASPAEYGFKRRIWRCV
jgi:hypothetical protein